MPPAEEGNTLESNTLIFLQRNLEIVTMWDNKDDK